MNKACISWFSVHIASAGAAIFVNAWNSHSIPGNDFVILPMPIIMYILWFAGRRGGVSAHIPNMRMNTGNRVKKIDPSLLPESSRAVQLYEQAGGRIRELSQFGQDPIADNATKCDLRKQAFTDTYPSFEAIFSNLVNGNSLPFKSALKFYIDITRRLTMN